MERCQVCARHCGAERLAGKKGKYCLTGLRPMVSAYYSRFGEERCLGGDYGALWVFPEPGLLARVEQIAGKPLE